MAEIAVFRRDCDIAKRASERQIANLMPGFVVSGRLDALHFAPFFVDFFALAAFFGRPDSFFGRGVSSGSSQ
jgi:hypothetical protein